MEGAQTSRHNSFRVLAVVVLFRQSLETCATWHTLLRFRPDWCQLMVVDHTAKSMAVSFGLPDRGAIVWLTNPDNPGPGAAYCQAAQFSRQTGTEWLLLLDQDSSFSLNYWLALERFLRQPAAELAAPSVSSGNAPLSPCRFMAGRGWRLSKPSPGLLAWDARSVGRYALISSGMCVRRELFERAGGYSPHLFLDFADLEFCLRVSRHAPNWYLLDASVAQDFSNRDPDPQRHLVRYASWAADALRFGRLSGTPVLQKVWIFLRGVRLSRRFHSTRFLGAQQTGYPRANALSTANTAAALDCSICLAACDGMPYLEEQIQSILAQMPSEGCELLIGDDQSSDGSFEFLERLTHGDARIVLHRNNRRLGVVANFESILARARGRFVFLSDQDDRWLDGKLDQCLAQLAHCDLVMHDSNWIKDDGTAIGKRGFALFPPSRSLMRTLWRNSYMGCCMAFRRDLLTDCLPFPRRLPMHDWWIALRALRNRKRIVHLAACLIEYRVHSRNYSATGESAREQERQSQQWRRRLAARMRLLRHLL